MKAKSSSLLALLSLCTYGSAHYVFPHLVVNGTESAEWQYVRDVANDNYVHDDTNQAGKTAPLYFDASAFVCGRSIEGGTNTQTATAIAGDDLAFRVQKWDYRIGSLPSNDGEIFHQGPAQIYMSRAPNDDLNNYKGDGDWFKIAYHGPLNDSLWMYGEPSTLWNKYINFTIPKETPPGKYLVRVEQFMTLDQHYSQWFVNCAQVKVAGQGGGLPGPFVKFPGAYKGTDPGIDTPPSYWKNPRSGLLAYVPPGPPLWEG